MFVESDRIGSRSLMCVVCHNIFHILRRPDLLMLPRLVFWWIPIAFVGREVWTCRRDNLWYGLLQSVLVCDSIGLGRRFWAGQENPRTTIDHPPVEPTTQQPSIPKTKTKYKKKQEKPPELKAKGPNRTLCATLCCFSFINGF